MFCIIFVIMLCFVDLVSVKLGRLSVGTTKPVKSENGSDVSGKV